MAVVDVSGWESAREEHLGTKPKQWLRGTDGTLWLWKESTTQRDLRHGVFRKGDDWAEVVAGRVAVQLGVPVAEVELATRHERFGIVSRSVLVDHHEVLVHGNELLAEAGVAVGRRRDRTGYTLAAVELVLAAVAPPVPSDRLSTAFDWFVGYLILDALVGNTDRHEDNWGTIRSPAGPRLSPSFDHASCLGFLLSDEERIERLTEGSGSTVDAYAKAATTKFEGRPTTIEAVVGAFDRISATAQAFWRARIGAVESIDGPLAEVPADRMTETARRFAAALFARNHELLSHRLRTMGP